MKKNVNVKKDQETTRRLTLSRETVQNLQPELLEIALGGAGATSSGPSIIQDNS